MCIKTIDNACPLCDAIESLATRSMGDARRAACERLHTIGWPTRRDDAFRYCDLKAAAETQWHPAPLMKVAPGMLDGLDIAGTGARLVFVNGRFDPDASSSLPAQTRLLAPMLDEMEFDRVADFTDDPFAQLSTAMLEDGVVIEVADGQTLPHPIHIVHITCGSGDPVASTLRVVIRLGRGARACVLETWAGEGPALVTPMTEVELAEGAHCDHARLVEHGDDVWHMGAIASRQDADSTFESVVLTVGGRTIRTLAHASLDGTGAHAALRGFGIGDGRRHIDSRLRVAHMAPDCTSREIFKHLLPDRSTAAFTARIFVQEGAHGTDAVQTSRNLLLSDTAKSWSRPELEIYADDVKCTHGATTGEIDPGALFYLRARGVPEATARALLAWAFAAEVVNEVPVAALRTHLARRILAQLPGAETLDEGVVSL
jgi:Fe-S cluster assembly protein SufD